jgi:dimethylhistidine N-methyltransferase
MHGQIHSHILSASKQHSWHSIEPSIWTLEEGYTDQEQALSILKTLLDQPRWLEAYHLYDERGSQLFEKICELPEYYLTRTENAILAQEAPRIIASAPVECIVELGAGFSKKTMHLLREQVRQGRGGTFAPIDVSVQGLADSRDVVQRQFPELKFHGLQARFEDGIASIEKSMPTLVVFLGSTVGNFTPAEFVRFFQHLSQSMGPGDFLLLGVDRVKEAGILEKAYNDSEGLTADFILNVFLTINGRTGSNFDLRKIRYHSLYNPELQRIEMYGIPTCNQEIQFPSFATSFTWEKDDRILVEISRKFDPTRLQKQLQFFGLRPTGHFTDPKRWFSVLLFQKSSAPLN